VVHGGGLAISAGARIVITSHSGCADPYSADWCDEIDTGTGRLSPGQSVLTVTIAGSRIVDERTHQNQAPPPASLWLKPGDRFELRFAGPHLLITRFITLGGHTPPRPADLGNPYWCAANSLVATCGA
jgi:hypothetical protein